MSNHWADQIKALLPLVTRPSRYLGGEVGSINKSLKDVRLRFAIAFPDTYEMGMSHLGFRIIYGILNSIDGVVAERAFMPWPDMERLLIEKGIPLCSQETRTPLHAFDVIGFSVPYEMGYSNLLHMLKLGGVPLMAAERTSVFPLVIVGGTCSANPEPIAPFVDAVVVGDGEEVVKDLVSVVSRAKDQGWEKHELLEALAGIEGVYVPGFFELDYTPCGTVKSFRPLLSGYTRVRRRIEARLPIPPVKGTFMVPFTEVPHDRASVEIARGCTRGCRFCQAGFTYRPVRERGVDEIIELASCVLRQTGYEELSLLSLSSGDYSLIEPLVSRLSSLHSLQKVAVSLPSLRVGTLPERVLEMIKEVRKTGITIAPEAGTERLRRVINKDITEEEILQTAERVFSRGWLSLKLYFMIGLPTETYEDLDGIVEICEKIFKMCRSPKGRPRLNVSLSAFVPKPHTPFQWCYQTPVGEIQRKLKWLRRELRRKGVNVKWQDPNLTMLESAFSRGDRRLAGVLLRAHGKGCRLDGWSEHLNFEAWASSFAEEGISLDDYVARELPLEEILPWDHLDMGISKEFLLQEYRKALRGEPTPDCRMGHCVGCGVCDQMGVSMTLASEDQLRPFPGIRAFSSPYHKLKGRELVRRFRIRYAKMGPARFLGHLELGKAIIRAMRRAAIPLVHSQGYHPMPKVDLGPALPLGVESQSEFLDIEVFGGIEAAEIVEALKREFPDGLEVLDCWEVPLNGPSVFSEESRVTYKVGVRALGEKRVKALEERLGEFLKAACWRVARKGGKEGEEKREVDLRRFVTGATLTQQGELVIDVQASPNSGFRLLELLSHMMGISEEEVRSLKIVKCASNHSDAVDTIGSIPQSKKQG